MSSTVFRLQSNKFGTNSIRTTLVCPKCQEIFSKEFQIGQEENGNQFKYAVCSCPGCKVCLGIMTI
jgi:hypothetical protein